jgi:hypothetical protein
MARETTIAPRTPVLGDGIDAETGLVYFGARCFLRSEGRFSSADWAETPEAVPGADVTNPKSLSLWVEWSGWIAMRPAG